MAASACGRDVKEAKNATEGDDDRLEEDGRLSGRSCRKLVMSTDIRKFKVQDEDLMVWNLMTNEKRDYVRGDEDSLGTFEHVAIKEHRVEDMFAPFGGVDVGPGEIIVIKAPQFKKARELRDLQHQADMALIKLEALDLDMEIASSDEDSNESCSCIDSEEERDSESDEESEEMETNTMPK